MAAGVFVRRAGGGCGQFFRRPRVGAYPKQLGMRLSVIVPTYNSERTLETCLHAVRASSFRSYELLVIDGGSSDATAQIAARYADRVIQFDGSPSVSAQRNVGVASAKEEIIVNVDSDVAVHSDTLERVARRFAGDPGLQAATGLVSKTHPHAGFFSQYKNLYMHYTFRRLPDGVRFLYGSIHAFRRSVAPPYRTNLSGIRIAEAAEDLLIGQQMACAGRVAFMRDLEVVHYKQHTPRTLAANDFHIPFAWAAVFLGGQGWRHLGRGRTGFGHVSVAQLLTVALAPIATLAGGAAVADRFWRLPAAGLAIGWLMLTAPFAAFLAKERGWRFGCSGILVTFVDHLIMAAGIVCGVCVVACQAMRRREAVE